MPISVSEKQKTSSNLDNFHVNYQKENGKKRRIGIGTLY